MQKVVQVLYQDAKHLCVCKPTGCAMQGLPYNPSGAKWKRLLEECHEVADTKKPLHIVHRLDSNTSGALLLAKTPQVARTLSNQFQKNTVKKTYLAIVDIGRLKQALPEDPGETIKCQIQYTDIGPRISQPDETLGKDIRAATTTLETLASTEQYALLKLNPTTGRKHQLRLVCSQLYGAPIVGDFKYGYRGDEAQGHLLHCFELRFQTWQKSGKMEWLTVHAPLPATFTAFAEKVKLDLSHIATITT